MVDRHNKWVTTLRAGKHLCQNWAVGRVDKASINRGIQNLKASNRSHNRWLVKDGLLDGIRANRAGLDVRVGSVAQRQVQSCHQVRDRVATANMFIFNFHQAKDVGVNRDEGIQKLGALSVKFKG